MKNIYWTMILAVALASTACNGDNDRLLPEQPAENTSASVCFNLTRSTGNGTATQPSAYQRTRAFVAERTQEHNPSGNEALHCGQDDRSFLGTNLFLKDGLTLQWYKFAFVCVPNIQNIDGLTIDSEQMFSDLNAAEGSEQQTTCDFARLWVDYSQVLDLQQNNYNALANANYDFHIYRGIVNRWTTQTDDPELVGEDGLPQQEEVVMKRITGLLHIDMGVLSDQFEHPVKHIEVNFYTPERVYVHDNATTEGEGEVLTEENRYFTYTYEVSDELRNSETEHCVFDIALLPSELTGATLTVSYADDSQDDDLFNLAGTNAQTIAVKPNIRTTILFNGMYTNEFEIRYAGFNDEDNAPVVDVDGEDEWTDVTNS